MPLSSLPVETVEHIIKLSLPPLRYSSFKKRYSLLRAYSLVNSTWRELGQRELWREVLVTRWSTPKIRDALAGREGCLPITSGGVWLQEMYLTQDGVRRNSRLDASSALRVMKASSMSMQRLTISDCALNLSLIGLFDDLEVLTTTEVNFLLETPTPVLPRLARIFIVNPWIEIGQTKWFNLLKPRTLPLLRHFSLLRTFEMYSGVGGVIQETCPSAALPSLAPQLESLAISDCEGDLAEDVITTTEWQRFTSLRHLTLSQTPTEVDANPLKHLLALPPQLETLTLISLGDEARLPLYANLKNALPLWTGHRVAIRLVVDVEGAEPSQGYRTPLDVDSELPRVIERGKELGFEITEQTVPNSLDDWATLFELW